MPPVGLFGLVMAIKRVRAVLVTLSNPVDHDVVARNGRAVDRDVVRRCPAREVATEIRVLHTGNNGQ